MRRLAQVGDFCPNSSCSNQDQCAEEGSPGIIIKHGKTRSGRQRFRCKVCGSSYAESNHLTMRHFNGRLVRKSLAFSKKIRMLAVSTAWEDLYYNFVRVHKTLRKPSRQAGKTQWIHKLRRWPPTWHGRHTRSGRSSALLYRNNT
jgi:hypothetical protein